MSSPFISLRRSLDLTMRDTLVRIRNTTGKDSQALIDEYKEWLDAKDNLDHHPHVLYINQITANSSNDHLTS